MKKAESSILSLAIGAAFLLTLVSCDGSSPSGLVGVSSQNPVQAQPEDGPTDSRTLSLDDQIAFSRGDLARRLAVEPGAIYLSGAHQVNWRSGALGCPQPGMNYTQALVSGILIIFRVADAAHEYHARQGGQPFYCPLERAEPPLFGKGGDLA
jgi:hypothetical protein